jgi:hypothetical protein
MLHALFIRLQIHKPLCCCVFYMLQLLQRLAASVSTPVQKFSPPGGYPGHDALLSLFHFENKNRQLCRNQSHVREIFLAESSTLREVMMAACTGLGVAAPSMLLAPTPPWLWCEGLRVQFESTGFHPTSFQKRLRDHSGSGLKCF